MQFVTAKQVRMARAHLDWTREDFATRVRQQASTATLRKLIFNLLETSNAEGAPIQ